MSVVQERVHTLAKFPNDPRGKKRKEKNKTKQNKTKDKKIVFSAISK